MAKNEFEELDRIQVELSRKHNFIFGLWPWQFVQSRKINKIKDFRPFYFETLKREYFIAEVEIELSQGDGKQSVTLRGCAVKTDLSEKIRLVILSNYKPEELNLDHLCNTYLSIWPNMEEAFQDFSRKIELSTYAVSSANQGSFDSRELLKEPAQDIISFFNNYLKSLDLFARINFLPVGYEDRDLSTMKEQFYNLKTSIRQGKNYYSVLFQPPQQYAFLDDLKYMCYRLNERGIVSADGKKYWFQC